VCYRHGCEEAGYASESVPIGLTSGLPSLVPLGLETRTAAFVTGSASSKALRQNTAASPRRLLGQNEGGGALKSPLSASSLTLYSQHAAFSCCIATSSGPLCVWDLPTPGRGRSAEAVLVGPKRMITSTGHGEQTSGVSIEWHEESPAAQHARRTLHRCRRSPASRCAAWPWSGMR